MESCSHAYQTSRVVHAASGASLSTCWPLGSENMRRLFESGAALCLLAAQAGNPDAIVGDGFEERLDLAQLAALIGRGLIEQAALGFLLGDGFFGQQVDEIQIPLACDAVAIIIGLAK